MVSPAHAPAADEPNGRMAHEKSRFRFELPALICLLLLFIAGSYQCELVAQENEARDEPSTLATTSPGAGALYELLGSLGYNVSRSTSPWSSLSNSAGLLVVLEPLARDPVESEMLPLKSWIMSGGTLLYVCSGQPRSEDTNDPVAGDVRLDPADPAVAHLDIEPDASKYLSGVKSIAVSSSLRIVPAPNAGYTTLISDHQGAVAVEKPLGKGKVIVVANDLMATNSGIGMDDNAVLVVNIASSSVEGHRAITFDEYHHGVGLASSTVSNELNLIGQLTLPIKLTGTAFMAFLFLVVYNGNRMRGPIKPAPLEERTIPADYINSMARLYSRSGSVGLALEQHYRRFMRECRSSLNASPDLPPGELISLLELELGKQLPELRQAVERCEQSIAGLRVSEGELVKLSNLFNTFRRESGLVGIREQ